MPPKKGKIVDRKFFNALGKRATRKYKDHIWNDEEDVYGRKFKGYSKSYKELKRSVKIKRQSASSRSSKAPFLTGDFKNDFTLLGANDGGFQMGWRSHGAKVNWLKKMTPKRVVTAFNQPMPKEIQKFILKMFHKKVEDYFPDNEIIRIRRRK